MQKTCPVCGSSFDGISIRRYCSMPCKRAAEYDRQRNGVRFFEDDIEGPIVKLADVPEWVRMAAFESLVEAGELSEDEIPLAFAAALEPGDISTRVAA